MATIPAPIVTLIPQTSWQDLTTGAAAVLKEVINITASGTTNLPAETETFISIYVNAAGAVTLLMPLAAVLVAGQSWLVVDTSGHADTNPITIQGNGSLISGASSWQINLPNGSATLEWNGISFSLTV